MSELPGVKMLSREGAAYARRLERLFDDAEQGRLQRIDLIIIMAELHELVRSVCEAEEPMDFGE